MAIPKSVTKVSKDGSVTYTQSVDRVNYTMRELTRAALRDVGKFLCKEFRNAYYSTFKKQTGNVGRSTQYWVKYKQKDIELQIGLKKTKDRSKDGFYGMFQEIGTKSIPKYALLSRAVQDNIAKIVEIESQYLSALEDEARALSLISEEDYEGGAE